MTIGQIIALLRVYRLKPKTSYQEEEVLSLEQMHLVTRFGGAWVTTVKGNDLCLAIRAITKLI